LLKIQILKYTSILRFEFLTRLNLNIIVQTPDFMDRLYLEPYQNRKAADVALHILQGAAYLYRIQSLKLQGIGFPLEMEIVIPNEAIDYPIIDNEKLTNTNLQNN